MLKILAILALIIGMMGIASAGDKPAGSCPAYNGVKNENAAPPIDPNKLAFMEKDEDTRTISVVASAQTSTGTPPDVIPGVMTVCKYPLDSNGDPDTTKVSTIVSIYGHPLWANDIACGSNDCVRF